MAITPLLQLLSPKEIEKMGSRSHLRLGNQIAENGRIVCATSNVFRRIATIDYKNNPTQTVEFLSDHKGLHYKCTCTNKKKVFCEHCIAVALNML